MSAKNNKTTHMSPGSLGTVIGVTAVLIGIIIAVVIGLRGSEKVESQAAPETATQSLGFPVGDADAPVTVDVYEDFQCPACGQFEQAFGKALGSYIDDGTVKVNYHMMAFLGPESERASAAAGCAADLGKFREFHTWAYTNQPVEKTGGYTTETLLAAGDELGLGETYAQCVNDDTYADLGKKVDDAAGKRGVVGTPTVYVDGRPLTDPTTLFAVIDQATAN